ncbi:cytidine deaminase-like protein [Aaosphaeria arxii CBS 175.79]|uniref:Cytidine deaminase-like protein n=1 Tax=Aaosphaeria arxii CBS 175.79 TaxID=1450172 RepID=A0A6A5XTQ3_9PLEO|nr:cytidine deaminase-like protein [Aaosphaeria arxii CBS 175.79]KAF2016735.1 cytidine deaminase-like protein [Aaosphaeria arxii CBS 175.79]
MSTLTLSPASVDSRLSEPKTRFALPSRPSRHMLSNCLRAMPLPSRSEHLIVDQPFLFRCAKLFNSVISKAIPDLKTNDFQHLRRVVQFKFLPPHLQKTFRSSKGGVVLTEDPSEEDVAEQDDTVRYFLVSPSKAIQHAALVDAFRQNPPWCESKASPRIFYVTVPTFSPTSSEQAAQWSVEYWPITYKNTNPYGPHPSLVARNVAEIEKDAGKWLALAEKAAEQVYSQNLGERVGCVIVDNSKGRPEIVAVAADSRWRNPTGEPETKNDGPGNVMAHAVERAIAMVGKKRLRAVGKDPDTLDRKLFCDSPLTDMERRYYELDNLPSNGYLCVELDIYVTHEPCVMCSMAILHSRFKRCIFGRRMPYTGGLTADNAEGKMEEKPKLGDGLGHGIFWRPSELNWKLLAWEFTNEEDKENGKISDHTPNTLQA